MCWCASACLTFATGGSCFDGGGGGRDKARQRLQQVGHEALGGHSWSKWDVGRVPGRRRKGEGAGLGLEWRAGKRQLPGFALPVWGWEEGGEGVSKCACGFMYCVCFGRGPNGACVRRFAKPMTSDDDDATPRRSPFPLLPQATASHHHQHSMTTRLSYTHSVPLFLFPSQSVTNTGFPAPSRTQALVLFASQPTPPLPPSSIMWPSLRRSLAGNTTRIPCSTTASSTTQPLRSFAAATPPSDSVPPAGSPRASARSPLGGGNASMKKLSVLDLLHKKRKQQRISMVTAYDYPSALHVDLAGIDIVLCGDSVAMVELGYPTTQPVNMEQMLHHCKAVARGAKRSLIVGDMPFGSYEVSEELAMTNAFRFIKEGFTDAVKIEGGRDRANIVQKIVKGGIAVMGHVGLTPQAISVLGGFRAQGRTAVKARRLVDDALALQDAGAFAVVIECVPAPVAQAITEALEIPTIGIGAGPHTSGQVLVYHDMLGMTSHPHHEAFVPRFCKRYAQLGDAIKSGLEAFKQDVEAGTFPSEAYSPYKMPKEELEAFQALMAKDAATRKALAEEAAERLKQSDEYEQIKLY